MISEILSTGRENAKTGREICTLLNITQRDLTSAVERERRAGKAICASTDSSNPGYYLAADKEEMTAYCKSLYKRAGEIFKTRRECLKTLDTLPEREAAKNG